MFYFLDFGKPALYCHLLHIFPLFVIFLRTDKTVISVILMHLTSMKNSNDKCGLLHFLFQNKSGKTSSLLFGFPSGKVKQLVSHQNLPLRENMDLIQTEEQPPPRHSLTSVAQLCLPLSFTLFLSTFFTIYFSPFCVLTAFHSHHFPLTYSLFFSSFTHITLPLLHPPLPASVDTLAQTHDKRHKLIHENVAALSQGLTTGLQDQRVGQIQNVHTCITHTHTNLSVCCFLCCVGVLIILPCGLYLYSMYAGFPFWKKKPKQQFTALLLTIIYYIQTYNTTFLAELFFIGLVRWGH